MNNLYNTDLPLNMRLSGVTVNTPDEYQNLLNALYKNTFADPVYVQQQRNKVSQGSSYPFAAGGIGDPVYEQAQAQEWKDYVQKKLGEFGIQAPQTPQVAEQKETPKVPAYAYDADPLTNNSPGPNNRNPFIGYGPSYPQASKENLDPETVQNVDKDQEKEQASQDFLDDYSEIVQNVDKDQEKEQASQGFLDDYIASTETQNDTLVAATYPSDPKWMREIDKLYQETKNKPYSPGESKPGRGMGDTWRPNKAELEQEKGFDTEIAAAGKGSDEKDQTNTFRSKYDRLKARVAAEVANKFRIKSDKFNPFRNTAFG